jgi:hypothetical protein
MLRVLLLITEVSRRRWRLKAIAIIEWVIKPKTWVLVMLRVLILVLRVLILVLLLLLLLHALRLSRHVRAEEASWSLLLLLLW